MNARLLRVLMLAYGAFGVGFAAWIGLAAIGVAELPLPLPVLAAAAAANLLLAFGIAQRRPATRWVAVSVHAIPTLAALVLAALHLLGIRPASGRWPLPELAIKTAIHGALLGYWLRSSAVQGWRGPGARDGHPPGVSPEP